MADEKKNRFGTDPFYCSRPAMRSGDEVAEEARREAMKLDDNEDSLKWRFTH